MSQHTAKTATPERTSTQGARGAHAETAAPVPSRPHDELLNLQRAVGNHAVNALFAQNEETNVRAEGGTPQHVAEATARGGGEALDASTRAFMESRFGQDLGQVRVHKDARAAESAESLGAAAYTVGQDVVFGSGQYEPGAERGRWLLAHELAHVVQQGRGGATPALDSSAPHEQEASSAASSVVQGEGAVTVSGATGVGVACAEEDEIDRAMANWHPVDQPGPAEGVSTAPLSPEELWRRIVQPQRGFTSTAPQLKESDEGVITAQHGPTVPQGKGGDPGGIVGMGVDTFAAVQVVSKEGRMVAVERGAFLRVQPHAVPRGYIDPQGELVVPGMTLPNFDPQGQLVLPPPYWITTDHTAPEAHAERQAIESLRLRFKGQKIQGGKVTVVVDQYPCEKCAPLLREFAIEIGAESLSVYVPMRASMAKVAEGKQPRQVTPKTAAKTSFMKHTASGDVPPAEIVLYSREHLGPGPASEPDVKPPSGGTHGGPTGVPKPTAAKGSKAKATKSAAKAGKTPAKAGKSSATKGTAAPLAPEPEPVAAPATKATKVEAAPKSTKGRAATPTATAKGEPAQPTSKAPAATEPHATEPHVTEPHTTAHAPTATRALPEVLPVTTNAPVLPPSKSSAQTPSKSPALSPSARGATIPGPPIEPGLLPEGSPAFNPQRVTAHTGEPDMQPVHEVGPSARGEAIAGGAQLGLQLLNEILNYYGDREQERRVSEALAEIEPRIHSYQTLHPDMGATLIVYYSQWQAPEDSPLRPGPRFERIELGFGQTPEAAYANWLDQPQLRPGLGYNVSESFQQLWVPPPAPAPLKPKEEVPLPEPPFARLALATFAGGAATLQTVNYEIGSGFDDVDEKRLDLPEGFAPRFYVLDMPKRLTLFTNITTPPKTYEKTFPVEARGVDGGSLPVLDLDPWLPGGTASAVCVFPADHATAELFDKAPTTYGLANFVTYRNFGLVRWVRPEHIRLIR